MKPTEKEIEIAKSIVEDLIDVDFFDAVICDDDDRLYFWCLNHQNYLKNNGLTIHSGETKSCVLSDKLPNWVIKVGFVMEGNTEDFCTIEANNFTRAIEEGLEDFFAASYKLCSFPLPKKYSLRKVVTFFIQERAEPDEEKTSITCEEYTGSDENEDIDRLESLFTDCKYKVFCKLLEFIDNWGINDLHSGNFGYTKDGKVKIIDYSGY